MGGVVDHLWAQGVEKQLAAGCSLTMLRATLARKLER